MSHLRIELDFRQYVHEKAQESRQKEIQACLMFLAGDIFFVGGILETLNLTGSPEWFLFIPYNREISAGAVLGLSLIIGGLSLMVFGIVTGLVYYRDRKWYMEELRKVHKEAVSREKLQLKQKRRIKKPKQSMQEC